MLLGWWATGSLSSESHTSRKTEVVPLGGSCLIAKHLQNKGIRVCKFPFDWMYSTPYLVRHALLDDFKTFLDTSKYPWRMNRTQ